MPSLGKEDRARSRLGAAVLLGFGFLVPLGLMECSARLILGIEPTPRVLVGARDNRHSRNFIPDSVTGWRMRPNHQFRWGVGGRGTILASDEAGFRMRPTGSEWDTDSGVGPAVDRASDATGTIVVVGDSQAFGFGVQFDETFGSLIDGHLPTATVANLAMPGFGLDQMWLAVRHQALPQAPELVIVTFIDQDFDRSLTPFRIREGFNKPAFVVEGDSLRPQTPADRPNVLLRLVEGHSALWTAYQRGRRRIAFSVRSGVWWDTNRRIMEAIQLLCTEAGVPVLFLRLPFAGETRAFPALERDMQRRGSFYVDLGAVERPENHLNGDPHLSVTGHRWVAEKILEWIENAGPEALRGPATVGTSGEAFR